MVNYLWIFLGLVLILCNAFFVAAEFGMVKLRHTRVAAIKDFYGFRGKILAHVHKHLDAYLSACQLGITLASLGLGWIGQPAFATILEPVFAFAGINSPKLIKVISFFTAFSIISFLHIVVGELMPKSLAIRQAEKVSVWTAVPLYGFYWLMYPAIWLLNLCSNFLLEKTGLTNMSHGEHFYSTDELKLILSASHLHGELTQEEIEILEHTLDFTDLKVTEVMRSRKEMIFISLAQSINEIFKIITVHKYTRYPVYDPQEQDFIGIIHVKDLLAALYEKKELMDIKELIRPILKIPRRLPALDLLSKFREGGTHFALIYDRKNTLLGFITLDNLLHVIIGKIKDEFHLTREDWIENPDGSLTGKGNSSIYSLERVLQDFDVPADIDTITGLILHRLDRMPVVGERVEFSDFVAEIKKIEGAYITLVKIYPKKSTQETL